MDYMDIEDAEYVDELNRNIHGLYCHNSPPASCTFWLSGEYLIGTSVVYKNKHKYWIPAYNDKPMLCRDSNELISYIKPKSGSYIAYIKGLMSPYDKWIEVARGEYKHEVIMRIGNRIIPERLRVQMEALIEKTG